MNNPFKTKIPMEPILVLLHMDICEEDRRGTPQVRALYQLYKFIPPDVDWDMGSLQYMFEQGQCPTNLWREAHGFVLEERPGEYNGDPHGLYRVKGWITCTEAEKLESRANDGGSFQRINIVQRVLELFKPIPEDWEIEDSTS